MTQNLSACRLTIFQAARAQVYWRIRSDRAHNIRQTGFNLK